MKGPGQAWDWRTGSNIVSCPEPEIQDLPIMKGILVEIWIANRERALENSLLDNENQFLSCIIHSVLPCQVKVDSFFLQGRGATASVCQSCLLPAFPRGVARTFSKWYMNLTFDEADEQPIVLGSAGNIYTCYHKLSHVHINWLFWYKYTNRKSLVLACSLSSKDVCVLQLQSWMKRLSHLTDISRLFCSCPCGPRKVHMAAYYCVQMVMLT